MSSSKQNLQPPSSTSTSDVDSKSKHAFLQLGFRKMNCNSKVRYMCLMCSQAYTTGKDLKSLKERCREHLLNKHPKLKNKKLKYWKELLEAKHKNLENPKPKLNKKEFLHKMCYTIGKSWYPPNVYNDIIKDILKISGQNSTSVMSITTDEVKTGIDQLESNLEQQIIDSVKTAKCYYLKLLTVRQTNAIFVNFFANNKLYEELLFMEKEDNNNSGFSSFMQKNQINLKKCCGICYYKGSKWINHIKDELVGTVPTISFIKINLNIYDLMANTRLFEFFGSLITRINEFKLIDSNFALLQSDLTDDESELLRCTNHDWLNVSKILYNFYKNRQQFILKNSNSTNTTGSLSGDEIIYCAFFCDVCKRLEDFRKDCNSKNSLELKFAIDKIIGTFECDARLMESNAAQESNINTFLRAENGPNSKMLRTKFKECLTDISNHCKFNCFDDSYDWVMNPFAKNNHLSAPEDLIYLLVNLKADFALARQFNAIENQTVTNILNFWYSITNPSHAHLQTLAIEKLLLEYNTNVYDKIIKISFEAKSHKVQDWHLRVKLSQFVATKSKENADETMEAE